MNCRSVTGCNAEMKHGTNVWYLMNPIAWSSVPVVYFSWMVVHKDSTLGLVNGALSQAIHEIVRA